MYMIWLEMCGIGLQRQALLAAGEVVGAVMSAMAAAVQPLPASATILITPMTSYGCRSVLWIK